MLQHLSPASQRSLLENFAHTSTLVTRIRKFRDIVLGADEKSSASGHASRTLEAFVEVLGSQIVFFERFIAQYETRMLRAHLQERKSTVVSLLSLEKEIRQAFSCLFDELNQIIDSSFKGRVWLKVESVRSVVNSSPSSFASLVLDDIFERIQQKQAFGDTITASFLLQVFSKTAEPLWQMLGRWLRDGILMPAPMHNDAAMKTSPLAAEFFIEYNDLNVADPDFWTDGFTLRSRIINESTSSDDYEVPLFLKPLAELILSAGKSIGFLRLLGHGTMSPNHLLSSPSWPTFDEFLSSLSLLESAASDPNALLESDLSTEKLSLLLSDHLLPICTESGIALKRKFFSECDFSFHVERIEDIFLMRRADIMSDFCDMLFGAVSFFIWCLKRLS